MKKTKVALAVALLIAILSGRAIAADASACYTVADADARAYCLAKARQEPAQCYAVQRADLRAQCLAEVRK